VQKHATHMDRLERRLLGQIARASADFNLLEPGDRVMVAVSGGKDSHALLYLLRELQRKTPFDFSIIAVNVDQGHPGFPRALLPEYFTREGYEYRIVEEDTYSIVKEKVPPGKTTCSLCSRLRRGHLYRLATELGATKIALGHHRDDILGTFFLNLFYGGRIKGMPPKLVSDDGRNVVIRPLAYVHEADLARFAEIRQFPIIPCNLCGSQDNLKRQEVKRMLTEWERRYPGRVKNTFNALSRVVPSHLMDRSLYDFAGLRPTGRPLPDGDIAFDEDPCESEAADPSAGVIRFAEAE